MVRRGVMRGVGVVVIVSIAALPAFAALNGPSPPVDATIGQAEHPLRVAAAKKKTATKKAAPKKSPAQDVAEKSNLPLVDRVNIQYELAWTGDFNGLINGDWTDRSSAAVKAFQKRNGFKETGTLAPNERALLATAARNRQERVGWRMVDDKITGAQVGLPTKQVPNASQGKSGTRWSSAQGQIQVETFRVREPGTTLATVYEQQKKEPANRRLEVNFQRNDFFILSGMQGLKKFYVRAEVKDAEVRGLTILYDQATEGIMDPVVVVMSSAFAPFPGSGISALIGPAPKRKVDYGTGIVVTAAGHILADAQATEGCKVLQIGKFGDAERIADDSARGLALLRLYGADALVPAALVHEGARGTDATLVGIGDPQAQGGEDAVTTASARVNGDGIAPTPPLGFAGAAAVDAQGRFLGMVTLKSAVLASAGPPVAPPATLVPVEDIRKFLDAQYVTPSTGRPGLEAMKASVVRVICVRR